MIIKDVNLNAKEWCDIVFEGKNKKYGAYYLRKTSSKRHLRALLIIAAACLLTVFLPMLIDQIIPGEREVIDEGIIITEYNRAEPPPEEPIQPEELPPPPKIKPELEFKVPEPNKSASDTVDVVTQTKANEDKRKIGDENVEGTPTDEPPPPKKEEVQQVTGKTEEEPVAMVEVKASFPGGQKAWVDYLNKNLVYPSVAKDNDISGRVIVRFVVTSAGEIKNVKVIKSVDESLDNEAMRVIKNSGKWLPGSNGGKSVASYFNQPIDFTLQR